jgi:hypothetical protein
VRRDRIVEPPELVEEPGQSRPVAVGRIPTAERFAGRRPFDAGKQSVAAPTVETAGLAVDMATEEPVVAVAAVAAAKRLRFARRNLRVLLLVPGYNPLGSLRNKRGGEILGSEKVRGPTAEAIVLSGVAAPLV